MAAIDVNRRVLPGFGLSLGYTLFYMGLVVMVPMVAGFLKAADLSLGEFWDAVSSERAVAAYTLTVGASLISALLNVVLGSLVAWVLVRYEFPLKGLLDSLVDFPFALPTAVAGLVFSALFVENGWYGRFLVPLGIEGAYSRLGIVLVLVFIGFPFVVRTLQPVIEGLQRDVEEAAACLGASRLQTVVRVTLPAVLPAIVTGFALAFARSLGEYGSVVFISGNMPFRTEIAPVLIVARLEEFAYAEAAAIAVVLLAISFTTLFAINLLERWMARHHA
jgi:sulfate transport system permease protein